MISLTEAQTIIRQHARPLPVESVPLAQCLQRTLAEDLASPANLPPFDNAAMDGYALCCGGDGLGAGVEFDVRGVLAAGDAMTGSIGADCCAIMTGAALPPGADTVVPVEEVEVIARDEVGHPARIRLSAFVAAGQHVRRCGQDIATGDLALAAGSRITSAHVLLAAGLGFASLPVFRRVRAAVLSTGRELVDDPASALQPGQIRNSNGPYLRARLQELGVDIVHCETVADDAAAFRAALASALAAGAEIVLSTGAVSMGRYDFIPPTLEQLGARIHFHKVAQRPGKPLLFATLEGGQLYFGLPGNPISGAVGLRFHVETALRHMHGLPGEAAWFLPLAHDTRKKRGFRLLQKARLQLSASGQLAVELLRGQESFKTQPLLASTVWASLAEADEELPAGMRVEVFALGSELGVQLGVQTA